MGYSILYVEDEINVSKNYSLWLETFFDKLYTAKDGLEAWEIYLEKKPDFLLVDICIPKINGLELIKKVRERNTEIPIVVLSAYSDKEKLLEAIKLNLVAYLVKPVNRFKFKETISTVLGLLNDNSHITFDSGFYWDIKKKRLFKEDHKIDLISSEIELVELLGNNKSLYFTSEEIYTHLWDDKNKDASAGSVRNLINKLRKKTYPTFIQNSYGRGYFIDRK